MQHAAIMIFVDLVVGMDDHPHHERVTFFATLFVMQACDFEHDQEFSQFYDLFIVEILVLVHVFFGVESKFLSHY